MKLDWRSSGKILGLVAGAYLILTYARPVLKTAGRCAAAFVPLVLGAAVAYVVNILMSFFEKYYEVICRRAAIRKLKRPLCLFLAFLSVFLVLVALCQMLVPQLLGCVDLILQRFPETFDVVYDWLEKRYQISAYLSEQVVAWTADPPSWDHILEDAFSAALVGIGEAMSSLGAVLTSAFSVLFNTVIALVFAAYVLMRKEKLGRDLERAAVRFIPDKARNRLSHIVRTLDLAFHRFIVGQCVEAVILGFLCIVGMWICRLPYAGMVGCLIGFTALIPVAGAYIGAVAGTFMIFTVSPLKAAFFLVFVFVLQQIEGNLIYPRVVGNSMGLPGIWVLAAVVVGGAAFGIPGILLGVPLAAAAYQLLREEIG